MIVRFFRHLEGTLIPALGTGLLLLTVVVISLSVPFAIREHVLNQAVVSGGVGLQENSTRIHFNKLQRDPWNEPIMNTSTYLPESNTAVAAAGISGFRLIIGSTLFAIFAFATSTGFARPAHPAPSTHPVADDGIAPGHDCSTSDSVKIFNAYKNGTELRQ